MDLIKKLAKDFNFEMHEFINDFQRLDGAIRGKLAYIDKKSERMRFLTYLKDMVETDYQNHLEVCAAENREECWSNKGYENALYSIKQQYDSLYAELGGTTLYERPAMQFFSEGKYFDAFTAIKEVIKQAKKSILLIDNYVNSDTLAFFPGKEPVIKLRIITTQKSMTDDFKRAVELYNKQYQNLKTSTSTSYHDRFLIMDEEIFYHIGASIKDAGNKTFMFSKIEDCDIKNIILKKIQLEWADILN